MLVLRTVTPQGLATTYQICDTHFRTTSGRHVLSASSEKRPIVSLEFAAVHSPTAFSVAFNICSISSHHIFHRFEYVQAAVHTQNPSGKPAEFSWDC